MGHHNTRDKIIDFVRNSPEEVNSKVAIFISGMQAQKDATDSNPKEGKYTLVADRAVLPLKNKARRYCR